MSDVVNESERPDYVPKVFISYSWTGKARAKRLADYLITECRVNVVIDIYHLKAGQHKYAFMQRIVDDESIDHVLILCDRAYRDKANNFEGGVGDEATIISPKIYKDANQTKFIPVVMEMDEAGNPYLPTFADGRIYFDLSNPKTEKTELKRIVRALYELPLDREPALGNRPKWLDFPAIDTTNVEDRIGVMARIAKDHSSESTLLISATQDFVKLVNGLAGLANAGADLPGMIAQTEVIRNSYVDFITLYLQTDNPSGDKIARIFEEINNGVPERPDLNSLFSHELDETIRFLLWDMFLSTTAIMIHYERFDCLKGLLGRTYFLRKMLGTVNNQEPVGYTYFRQYFRQLEDVYRMKIEQQRPYSLAGRILVNRVYPPAITKTSLVNADIVLSHLSVVFAPQDDQWYPTLAPYCHYSGHDILWSKAISRSYCKKLFVLFGAKGIHEFKFSLENMDKAWNATNISKCGMAFGGIPSVSYLMPLEKIGTLP